MLNYDELLKSAPSAPRYEAIWAPVYLEPMMGSGEKFTVIIAAYAKDGTVRVCSAMRPHVVKAMYGNKHSQFNSIIDLLIESLETHLKSKGEFQGWVPPFISAQLGSVSRAQSSDMTGVLRQAIQLTASLSSLDFFSSEDENDEKYSSENTWSNQLKAKIISEEPSFEQYFHREFKVDGQARAAKIFYLSSKIAINTDRLIPTNLSTHLDRNKARILDLLSVKDHDIFERNVFEFIVYRPQSDDPTYSKPQFIKLNEALHTLEEVGDKHSIRVISVTTVQQAALRLIKAEKQAA
ncbi:hypothetical protein P1J85_002342 [Salmonella enterica]|nr:hypothetical protein [Salmonella enterica]ECO1003451.1 hypothetical protein [Salmonella enterica subsp. enterica serovar Give]ECS7967835.1 hypothetical protein [Salmonella enterica subsp. enterica serovar Poona]EDI3199341.1 hypothetical protein [Salmonella enterica subsp. enterica serovar Rubislaw]EDQ6552911.1 hypothetical protein [Salmonella enterica subsp. enterica]EGI6084965.1 hypothetical protein [Salmonella enterica subsp. enterica serovar Urbana]